MASAVRNRGQRVDTSRREYDSGGSGESRDQPPGARSSAGLQGSQRSLWRAIPGAGHDESAAGSLGLIGPGTLDGAMKITRQSVERASGPAMPAFVPAFRRM